MLIHEWGCSIPGRSTIATFERHWNRRRRDGSWGRYNGPHSAALIRRLREMHGTEHVALCSSGTVAVELALRGLKIGAGDEVILAGYDFPGNFRAIEAVRARPVLVDIDPHTWCLDAAHLPQATGVATKAIIVSHLHGGMAAMREIMGFAEQHGVAVVEDACQAPGAIVNGRLAGTWGDVSVTELWRQQAFDGRPRRRNCYAACRGTSANKGL